jgi:hypothetical protein
MAAGHTRSTLTTWLGVAARIYVLLVGVGVIGNGFKWISGGAESAGEIFAFAGNPTVGVFFLLPGIVFGGQALPGNTEPGILDAEAKESLMDSVERDTGAGHGNRVIRGLRGREVVGFVHGVDPAVPSAKGQGMRSLSTYARLALLLIVVAVCGTGCIASKVTLSGIDSSTHKIRVGGEVVVVLPASTQHREWRLTKVDSVMLPSTMLPRLVSTGTGSEWIARFEARKPGMADIEFTRVAVGRDPEARLGERRRYRFDIRK